MGWYYIPLKHGRSTWIDPYHSAKIDDLVISYVVPVYKAGTFIGVIGMDIKFDTLVAQVREFTIFKTGFFSLTDEEGRFFYHPEYDRGTELKAVSSQLSGIVKDLRRDSSRKQLIRYEKNGRKWQMTYTTLSNGMKLAAAVQESEINTYFYNLTKVFVTAGLLILLAFVFFTAFSMKRLTTPLKKLTSAADRLAAGDYDAKLVCESDDEVGALTRTFLSMRDRLKAQFTELSDSKKQLQEALAASQQASLAKTTFLSNMSHEIRTPLNAINGFTALAEQHINDRERVLNYILKISTSGKHLLSLINDVLDVSRIESGRLVLRDEVFSFPDFLVQINTIIGGQCSGKGHTYSPRIIGTLCRAYSGDEMKLKEVLINILANAVKYTPSGGKISFSVEQIASYNDLCTLRFIVKDNGVGMSEEFLPKLFNAFAQEDDSKPNQFGSTGLGMAITKSIVQLMNGEINVESKKGVGSTFTITVTLKDAHQGMLSENVGLPGTEDTGTTGPAAGGKSSAGMPGTEGSGTAGSAAGGKSSAGMPGTEGSGTAGSAAGGKAPAVLPGAESSENPETAASGLPGQENAGTQDKDPAGQEAISLADLRVLIVEDIEFNAELLEDLLDLEDIEHEWAENGQIAVDLFSRNPEGYYDAILMDIRMPVMDGLQATRAIRALQRPDAKTISIIAMSANAFAEDVQQSLQAGMNAHLSKPVDVDRLLEALGKVASAKS